jgi:hypothetical protein
VEFGWASPERMALFAFVLAAVWAMPTHYAARMLLDTDSRLQNLLAVEKESRLSRCLASSGVGATGIRPYDVCGDVIRDLALRRQPAKS